MDREERISENKSHEGGNQSPDGISPLHTTIEFKHEISVQADRNITLAWEGKRRTLSTFCIHTVTCIRGVSSLRKPGGFRYYDYDMDEHALLRRTCNFGKVIETLSIRHPMCSFQGLTEGTRTKFGNRGCTL